MNIKINIYIKKLLVSIFMGCLLIPGLLAQTVVDYDVSVRTGSFQSIASGSNAIRPVPVSTIGGIDALDEGVYENIPIGFPFNYLGFSYNTFSASTNGWAALNPSLDGSRFNNSLIDASIEIPAPVFAPLWDDLSLQNGGTFAYQTVGDPGQRIFTAEWSNASWSFEAGVEVISFQVILYEEFDGIEFVYRSEGGTPFNASASVGITEDVFDEFVSLTDLSANPTFLVNTEVDLIADVPSDGQRIIFFPSVTGAGRISQLDGFAYNFPYQSILESANSLQGNADDGYYNNIPIGFSFRYLGQEYQTLSASTNGWLTLGAILFGSQLNNNLDSVQFNLGFPVLAPLWDDLSLESGRFAYNTTGEFGRRVFTAEWLNAFWNFDADDFVISFQVKLYEEDGRIEYVYRREVSPPENGSATIGIADGFGAFISLGNSSDNPPLSTSTETNQIDRSPQDGQRYVFSLDPSVFASNSWTLADYSFQALTPDRSQFTEVPGQVTFPEVSEGDLDEGIIQNIPIGFSFSYAGQNYTSVGASTNGFLKLGGDIRSPSPANSLERNPERPILAPLWDDLEIDDEDGYFAHLTEGNPPNRVFTAEWGNVYWPWNNDGITLSFQVKLYEEDSRIEFIYDDPPGSFFPSDSASASIGITGESLGRSTFLSIREIDANQVSVDDTRESRFLNDKPSRGLTYTFRLPNLFIVTNTNFTGSGSLSDAITDANLANDRSFIFFRITEPGPWFITGTLPEINQSVILDATTQPGWSANPNSFNVVSLESSINFNRVDDNLNPDGSEIYGIETFGDIGLLNTEDIRIGSLGKPNFIRNQVRLFESQDVLIEGNEIESMFVQVSVGTEINDNIITQGIGTFASPNMSIRRNTFNVPTNPDFFYIDFFKGSNSVTVGGEITDANTFDLSQVSDSAEFQLISLDESRGVSVLKNSFICTNSTKNLHQIIDLAPSAVEIDNRIPELTSIVSNNIEGKGFPGDQIEVYALELDSSCADRFTVSYRGQTTVDSDSVFSLTTSFLPGNYVVATATDSRGNTTPFSDSLLVPINPPILTRTFAISEELVNLQWNDNNNEDPEVNILIYRRLRDSTDLTPLDTVNNMSVYGDSSFFDAGATYVYVLRAEKEGVISDFGNELGVAIPGVVLSLEANWLDQVSNIYPNPMEDQLFIEFSEALQGRGPIALEVHNVIGHTIFQEVLSASEFPLELDTQAWPRGVYYLKIRIDGQELIRKIVKQ